MRDVMAEHKRQHDAIANAWMGWLMVIIVIGSPAAACGVTCGAEVGKGIASWIFR